MEGPLSYRAYRVWRGHRTGALAIRPDQAVQPVVVVMHCETVIEAVLLTQPPHVATTLTVWQVLSGSAG